MHLDVDAMVGNQIPLGTEQTELGMSVLPDIACLRGCEIIPMERWKGNNPITC